MPELAPRRVFTKTIRGTIAVRKYVLLTTSDAAPFVLLTTDYSAGRKKAPLKVRALTAGTRDSAAMVIAGWLKKNAVSGWTEHGVERVTIVPEAA